MASKAFVYSVEVASISFAAFLLTRRRREEDRCGTFEFVSEAFSSCD
jgi:hypothetical protein